MSAQIPPSASTPGSPTAFTAPSLGVVAMGRAFPVPTLPVPRIAWTSGPAPEAWIRRARILAASGLRRSRRPRECRSQLRGNAENPVPDVRNETDPPLADFLDADEFGALQGKLMLSQVSPRPIKPGSFSSEG